MEQLGAGTLARDIRVPLVYSTDDIQNIASEIGLTVSDDESAVIMDHIDREVGQIARAAAARALHARIVDLLGEVSSLHGSPSARRTGRRRTWISG